jgi:hypothetical protein
MTAPGEFIDQHATPGGPENSQRCFGHGIVNSGSTGQIGYLVGVVSTPEESKGAGEAVYSGPNPLVHVAFPRS